MIDIQLSDLIEIISFLEARPPMTAELDKWGTVAPDQKGHMLGWFSAQGDTGTGPYSRSVPNTSARTAYNRFLNPGGLLWLAEVLGETEDNLRKAVKKAADAEVVNYRKRCSAFRSVVPFERVCELLENPAGWLYDLTILPLLGFRPETGQPYLKPGNKRRYWDALKIYCQ